MEVRGEPGSSGAGGPTGVDSPMLVLRAELGPSVGVLCALKH